MSDTLETPQDYVVATECKKAAFDNGYRRPLNEVAGWAQFDRQLRKATSHWEQKDRKAPGS